MKAPALILALTTVLSGCSGDGKDPKEPNVIGPAPRAADGTILDDRSMCNVEGRNDVEVSETAGPGALQPNVRRVWQVFGTGANRRRVLHCREIDTNLDGYKDVVRFYNEEGQSKEERADTNFDGNVDTWNVFASGRLAEVKHDRNHDGRADEWKVYLKGKLSRIKRDTDFNGKADVWEMYRKGRLERMGVDVNGDERVDRWDHDKTYRKRIEEERRMKEEKAERERKEREEELRKAAEEAF